MSGNGPGRLITVEGLDGAGKSTVVEALGDCAAFDDPEVLQEPGGTQAGTLIRSILKDPGLELVDLSELLLFNAARAQLVTERIRPALEDGRTVILDRFIDSTVAYQGYGRGLGPQRVRSLCRLAAGGLTPDLTLYLRISPETAASRRSFRGESQDRIEASGERFFAAVARGFDLIASDEPDRVVTIDAELDPQKVRELCLNAAQRLG